MIESYVRWWRTTGRSTETVRNYRYVIEHLAERLGGERALLAATRSDLEQYLADRMELVSPATVSADFRALRSFYGWLHAEGEIDRNPAERLRGPKVAEAPVKVATELDVRRLLAACPRSTPIGRRDAAMIGLLWHCGMRRGELVVLDVEHVDLDLGVLTIPRTKGGTPRRVPLNADAVSLLDRWIRKRGPAPGALFLSEHGRRLTSNGVGQMLQRRCADAGVDVSAHTFRRALAERWLRAGGGETALRSIAGWRSPAMVARYSRMAAEELSHVEYRRLLG